MAELAAQTEMIVKIMTEWKEQLYSELKTFDEVMKTIMPETPASNNDTAIPRMAFQLAMRLKEQTLTGIKDVDMTISKCLFRQAFKSSEQSEE